MSEVLTREEQQRPYAYLEPRIHGALTQVIDPEIRRPITQLGMVSDITVDDAGAATVTICLTIATCPNSKSIRQMSTTRSRKSQVSPV